MPHLISAPLKVAIHLLASVEKLITSVLNAILRLCGMQMSVSRRELPTVSKRPSDIIAEIQSQISSTGAGDQKLLKPTTDAGHILYRFARMRPEERAAMDLSGLTAEQQDWLLLLSDADLDRLTEIDLDGCTRAMSGKRCGIRGLPAMQRDTSVEASQSTAPVLVRRILAHKQASFA
ncbi:hypothetical protein CQ054_10670 [Ochrobactrum sp. MYb29]|nr:hypothetical protein CQ054_10670 [Ochrobactrum sp. MYb29]